MGTIQRLAVLGAGQMGAGIAQVGMQAGYEVMLFDSFSGVQERATTNIKKSLEKLYSKGVIKESPASILQRLQFVGKLYAIKDFRPQLVIEAVPENYEIKRALFVEVDELVPNDCVLASNTSSISITRLAGQTQRADRFAGMHFMNPVPLMPLVELIKGMATSEATFDMIKKVTVEMGKTFIVANDKPGFAVNRILCPMMNEAFFALEEGVASAEDIDRGMKLGTNQPMGPLTLADFVGLDTLLAICEVLHRELGDDKYRPAPLLRKYVEAGWYGVKTKRGVYKYE